MKRLIVYCSLLFLLILLLSGISHAAIQRPAEMVSPVNGETLNSSSVIFTWNAGVGVGMYFVVVGTTPGYGNLGFGYGYQGYLSYTLSKIPQDGTPVYVRLYSLLNGQWQYKEYQYQTQIAMRPAEMISPADGETLNSSSTTFTWDEGAGVDAYFVVIGTKPAYWDVGYAFTYYGYGEYLSYTSTKIPQDGSPIYVRLYSVEWGQKIEYRDYVYLTPVDGGWCGFSEWGDCSAECGGGIQERHQVDCSCPASAYGGADCPLPITEYQDCNQHSCAPVCGDAACQDGETFENCPADCELGLSPQETAVYALIKFAGGDPVFDDVSNLREDQKIALQDALI